MTEKKPQSTVQPEQIQGFNSPAEDELSLIDLLRFLARKKIFILAITSVCTLCSIFYAQSITPLFRATVSFLDPKETIQPSPSYNFLPKEIAGQIATKPVSIYNWFLYNTKSYELKQEVFVNGGFQKKFFRETEIVTDQSVLEIYNSTKTVSNKGKTYLKLEGSNPKVMLEFLTALVEAAKEKVNTQLNDKVRSTIKTKINNLSTQIEELHQKIALQKLIEKDKKALQKLLNREAKAKEIVSLSKSLDMAKQMGIKNNNFLNNDVLSAGINRFPLWFLYGELALQEKINRLKSEKETPNTKKLSIAKLNLKRIQQKITSLKSKKEERILDEELSAKILKLKRLQTDVPLLKFKVVNIGKRSYSPVKSYQRSVTIGFGVAFGLFISILMAFLIELKQLSQRNPL